MESRNLDRPLALLHFIVNFYETDMGWSAGGYNLPTFAHLESIRPLEIFKENAKKLQTCLENITWAILLGSGDFGLPSWSFSGLIWALPGIDTRTPTIHSTAQIRLPSEDRYAVHLVHITSAEDPAAYPSRWIISTPTLSMRSHVRKYMPMHVNDRGDGCTTTKLNVDDMLEQLREGRNLRITEDMVMTGEHNADDFFPLAVVARSVRDEIRASIETVQIALRSQGYRGRQKPSWSKLNYILHLSDHCRDNRQAISFFFRTLDNFKIPGPQPEEHWLYEISIDLKFLLTVLDEIEKEAVNISATGIFGMNIKEINGGAPKWWAVIACGLSLVLVTVIVPLSFDKLLSAALQLWAYPLYTSVQVVTISLLAAHPVVLIYITQYHHLDLLYMVAIAFYAIAQAVSMARRVPRRTASMNFFCVYALYVVVFGTAYSVIVDPLAINDSITLVIFIAGELITPILFVRAMAIFVRDLLAKRRTAMREVVVSRTETQRAVIEDAATALPGLVSVETGVQREGL
ncbi:hypothetical protein FH972_024893 [Carpinus fangiana]|uniref:Uncharacterized protein n=1 Tax=Carpinus fangiana TaxID=176857 RepID=A0A5N6KZT8_9ROSI|nr:hypothetical protein FH972_024893 [Carpinus fangiana]